MRIIINFLKNILPYSFISFFTRFFYGWTGNYQTWQDAQKKCTGYDAEHIVETVKQSTLAVVNGKAAYERDSMLFYSSDFMYPILSGLMWIAAKNQGQLNIIDFGGSLGSTYHQHQRFFADLNQVSWNIVEQSGFVTIGNESFANKQLHFYHSIDECIQNQKIDAIILSGVLQYIEQPYELLEYIFSKKFNYILFDRTPYISGNDRITIQKVHPTIYKASYPCWFFNEQKFKDFFNSEYQLVTEFNALDQANIPSKFKGFIFKRKNTQHV